MPTDDYSLLNFTNEPLSISFWSLVLVGHGIVKLCSVDELIAMLYLEFPFDGTCADKPKELYRRLFLCAHILQRLQQKSKTPSIVAARFIYLHNMRFGQQKMKFAQLPQLQHALANYPSDAPLETNCCLTNVFREILSVFSLARMQYDNDEQKDVFTLEKAICINLIHPPPLSKLSPLLGSLL